jgi:hypothetical protein
MAPAPISRFANRDRGLRRVRLVTAWSAAGSAGIAVVAALALVPSTASTASTGPRTTGTPAGAPGIRRVPGDTAGHFRTPAATHRPRPRHTTSAPRLEPPTTAPAPAELGPPHAASGGS